MARPTCLTTPASRVFFPEPAADRVAGDSERACQAAQTGAFFVGSQDLLALLRRVAVRLRVIAAHFAAVITHLALLAVVGFAVTDKIFAVTVITF